MDNKATETLRERLIVAGIDEISTNGIRNFSLRRVAAICNTSCAAPYKHFKNKEELIGAIVQYITEQWALLRDKIVSVFEGDAKKQLVEISLSYIKFCVANPAFHSVLTKAEGAYNLRSLGMGTMLSRCCDEIGVSEEKRELVEFSLTAILLGAVTLIGSGEAENSPHTFDLVRMAICNELENK